MHLELLEDLEQGVTMLRYLVLHPEEFTSILIPMSICLMQCIGGLSAEGTNLFMIATRTTSDQCVTFFVAFHVLSAIDSIYVESFANVELLEAVEEPLYFTAHMK